MSEDAAWLLLGFLVIAGGIGAIFYLRITREAHDAAYSEPEGGFTRRSELPLTLCPPYDRFPELFLDQPHDILEGTDEGYQVAYFDVTAGRTQARMPRPCAIVQVHADATAFEMRDGEPVPAQAGPEATEVLRYLAGMRVAVITDTVFVRSTGATREMVQRTALRLARAIEADARG